MEESVKGLQRDLARKYKLHGPRVEQIWQSLGQEQQEKAVKDGAKDGLVLKDPLDRSLGNVYKVMPEWNLRDLTRTSPSFLLDMIKHRATSGLHIQYNVGVNGGPGDHAHIVDMMQRKGLQLTDTSQYKDCYTFFFNEEQYGQSIRITSGKKREVLEEMKPALRAQLIIPQSIGELILIRQMHLLQCLNLVIEDILDTTSDPEGQTKHSKKPAEVATKAMAKFSLHSPPEELDLSQLLAISFDQQMALEDNITLTRTEPIVLAHEVNFWFFTRPELLADEKGRTLPLHTDQYITGAVLDAIHGAVKAAAVWTYIFHLLTLLKGPSEKTVRATVLQEISNTCHLEYIRAQTILKRSVYTSLAGRKWFKRISATRKDGLVRVSLNRNPECLTRENPQLHYLLRLCQDETNWSKSAQWIQKLEDLHRAHPLDKDEMTERELDSLGDLAVIVTLIQSLSSIVQLPVVSHKKGQLFVSGYSAIEKELRQLRTGVDLGDFAIPIDNLLQPGMATGALTKLDDYILQNTGTSINLLYQDLIDECASRIQKCHEEEKTEAGKVQEGHIEPVVSETQEILIQCRRQKEKTRPSNSSFYELRPQAVAITEASSDENPPRVPEIFKVKTSTFNIFSSLLSRSSTARGSISWDAFAGAMTDLGFSVTPKVGSIYTFVPPKTVAVQRKLTLHRPHQSNVEGARLLVFSRRLKRVYGWDESTFVES